MIKAEEKGMEWKRNKNAVHHQDVEESYVSLF
jgi:hypothetical protein